MNLKQRTLKLLQNIGLSESEAKLYLAAYKNPGEAIKDLQKKSKLSKSSAYRAFENLKSKGLVLADQTNWRQNVNVISLKKLRTQLVKQQRILKKMELQLEEVDGLMGLTAFSHMEEPLEVLMNKNDIAEKADSLLYKGEDHFYVYGSAERLIDVLGRDVEQNFIQKRVKKGIKTDCHLSEMGDFTKTFMPNNDKEIRNVKLKINDKEQDHITYIFKDEVIRWQNDEIGPRGIIIRDPELVKIYLEKFWMMWKIN